ncbi:hypothetical protein HYX13_03170 [Candidatus Woesearchaeota archaeon]|nr:hypothetical protein [Candidatus Woesearchaeota archaeon]
METTTKTMERKVNFGIHNVFDTTTKSAIYDNISIIKGKGRGSISTQTPPSFEEKVAELDALVAEGKMEARDWKCRYNGWFKSAPKVGVEKDLRTLNLRIGPTSWGEWKEDYKRSEEEAKELQNLGLRKGDQGFYLSNGLGATILTLTREGDVVVGIRKSDSYDGAVHGAAGWMTFNRDVSKINPIDDAYRELQEELAVQPSEVSTMHLIGLVAQPKTLEADFVFVAQTNKEREYFTSETWKKAVDAREHRDLIVLSNPLQIQQLVENGRAPSGEDKKYEILASTSYGLSCVSGYWDTFHK